MRFLMASSIWEMAFSRPERLLMPVNAAFKFLSWYSLLHAFLPTDVELRDHTFGAKMRASFAIWCFLLTPALDLRLAAVDL